jgi:hypothetical protein
MLTGYCPDTEVPEKDIVEATAREVQFVGGNDVNIRKVDFCILAWLFDLIDMQVVG